MRVFGMMTSEDLKRLKELDEPVKIIEELKKEIEKLKAELARAKEDHQYDNLVHENELKSMKK